MGSDYDNLRNYILGDGQDDSSTLKAPEGQVRLEITHSVLTADLLGANNWKNFQLDQTISQFKEKLHRFVGTDVKYMKLQLREADKSTVIVETLDSDDQQLLSGIEQIKSGLNIHIIDNDPNSFVATLQDTESTPHVKMSDAEYDQREGTYRKWKQEQEKTATATSTTSKSNANLDDNVEPVDIKVGQRCMIISDSAGRIGTVAYIGKVDGAAAGYWIGIALDFPQGKNDGSLKGKRYFECQGTNYGCFVRAKHIQIGDYPEEEEI
ncbi:tubulin folding cofactor B [Heterostelium album PN500]|uniref:Tubulin folding cofactor B n=1 Tax=Heterostelium pallidum (strain ATCC 26659 / Pp 5 / PN500) TaxID=670386 RepID=D3AYP4_HETP5|nr:tubulin folding cofactor B [Heterostelium album PN500]EFA86071.1 tubulin folding cofactor B [Heterostelium album PN500]|eukprot:XP_020438177.1 tubulin folding cofactor B [Heterostelium album PN500]